MSLAGTLATAAVVAALLLLDQLGGAAADGPYLYPPPTHRGPADAGHTQGGPASLLPPPPPGVINNGIAGVALGHAPYAPAPLPMEQRPLYGGDFQDGEVQRHVYVHVAPDEAPEARAPVVVNMRKPRKHYKIVFIKAPTVPPPAAAHVNVAPPDQEKTLIYVLSKKPELQPQVVVSTPAPTPPAKPEVFFIRYNTITGQPQLHPQSGLVGGVLPPANSYGVPLGAPLGSLPPANLGAAIAPEPLPATSSNAL